MSPVTGPNSFVYTRKLSNFNFRKGVNAVHTRHFESTQDAPFLSFVSFFRQTITNECDMIFTSAHNKVVFVGGEKNSLILPIFQYANFRKLFKAMCG